MTIIIRLHQEGGDGEVNVTVSYNEEADYCEFQKEYGQDVGITLCGELDDHDQFDMEYYFPYFQGSGVTTYADVSIEKRIEREQYVGICEDAKVGISLIFTMQNGVEYMKERQLGMMTGAPNGVTFSGLALSGRILLPVASEKLLLHGSLFLHLPYNARHLLHFLPPLP